MIELIPSAKRLIRSLRDIGYDFVDAVADIIDNSIEAEANHISINMKFEGEQSYLVILDNGFGMGSKEIQEALRFGSHRSYATNDDLGRFGLGLKTASLSQCESLTVSSRRGEQRKRISSLRWDLDHITKTNLWEVLEIPSEALKDEARRHLENTVGTAVTWERLGKLMGYKYPSGEWARRHADQMAETLKLHLGLVFHRFLSGEIPNKRISIFVNDEKVAPWDPFSRGELYTQKLDIITIPIEHKKVEYQVTLQPYILPTQALYSSAKAHVRASGPLKWNRHQGFYIYRSNRIIQAGGWSGLRTSDEHTKLIRIAFHIPAQLDDLFQVNVAKKHLTLPRELRSALMKEIPSIVQRGQDTYRGKVTAPSLGFEAEEIEVRQNHQNDAAQADLEPTNAEIYPRPTPKRYLRADLIANLALKVGLENEREKLARAFEHIIDTCDANDREHLISILDRYEKITNYR